MAVQKWHWPKWADLKGSGLVVSAKPDEAALEPGSADGKQLVGRSILYHWTDLGWCSGIIKKANGDTSKTVDGDVVNFEIYYEVDKDLSHHVLDLAMYVPDGPANSWVLLQEPVMAEPPANPAQGEASGEDGAGDGDGGCGGVCWVSVEGAKPGWWPAQIIGAFPQEARDPRPMTHPPAHAHGYTLTHSYLRATLQAELSEGCLRVRLFSTGEEREIQADEESMAFDGPEADASLQQVSLKFFRSEETHAKFKAAVAEARRCLGLEPLQVDQATPRPSLTPCHPLPPPTTPMQRRCAVCAQRYAPRRRWRAGKLCRGEASVQARCRARRRRCAVCARRRALLRRWWAGRL